MYICTAAVKWCTGKELARVWEKNGKLGKTWEIWDP